MYWPYRNTKLDTPFLVQGSGGFEGMALTTDGKKLLPLLEKPLVGAENNNLFIHEFDLQSKSYTNNRFEYPLDERASAIGDFIMFSAKRGLIIERDGSQGDLEGYKAIYEVEIDKNESLIEKKLNVDLLDILDLSKISMPGMEGDIGIGRNFAFPFVTIESVVVLNPFLIGVLNDNNYPFSVGRHIGTGLPDDNEFILIWLDEPLGKRWRQSSSKKQEIQKKSISVYPNTFREHVTFSNIAEEDEIVSIHIYDMSGTLITTLVDNQVHQKDSNYIWDGNSDTGQQVNKGIYFAIIDVNGELTKKKLIKQ